MKPLGGDGFASCARRGCRVATVSGFEAPALFPAHGSVVRHPLPSPGSLGERFPRLGGTRRCSDALPPARRAALPSLGATPRGARLFAPPGPGPEPGAGGWSPGSPGREVRGERRRASPVPGGPAVPRPCSEPPAGPGPPGRCGVPAWPPLRAPAQAPARRPFRGSLAGPGPWRSTLGRGDCSAPTPDALPAAWPRLSGRGWLPAGSLRKVSEAFSYIASSFPKLS